MGLALGAGVAAGMSFADRGRRTDEALRVRPALVTGQPARLILIPTGDWERDYERAAELADSQR